MPKKKKPPKKVVGPSYPRKFRVTVAIDVEVTVNDPDVFERVTGPNGDEWRAHLYNFTTEDQIVRHLAYNCAVNSEVNACQLDGWADLPKTAVNLQIDYRGGIDVGEVEELKP